jgi:hypothetical protein
MGRMTPLSWCIVASTAANVAIAAMVAWFLFAGPIVRVRGYVSVAGPVEVDGTVVTKPADDAVQKVEICEAIGKYTIHCASLDQHSVFGMASYSLSVAPVPSR